MAKKAKKTAKKKAKKANNRGKWSTKPIVSLEFLNTDRMQKGGEYTKVSKSGIYFSPEHGDKLGIKQGDFVLFAKSGDDLFVAKKPVGLFGGHKLSKSSSSKKAESKRLWVNIAQKHLTFPLGQYDIGKTVRTSLPDHKGKEIRFEAYRLIPL